MCKHFLGIMRVHHRGSVLSVFLRITVFSAPALGPLSANAADVHVDGTENPATASATQDQSPPKGDATTAAQATTRSAGLEEIVVTGSRIPIAAKDVPTQDVQIYTREQIDQSGHTTISEFLNTLPDVSISITENGFQTLQGTTTVQLHGLPIGTTLLLVNGRRVGNSGAAQAYGLTYFDLNTIPLAGIDHIEVVSEGSSAVYGSDAIAGVVNIVLKKDFNGFEANSKYGFASGAHQEDLDATWGRRWDKGSVAVVGSYQTRTELPGFDRFLTSDNDYVPFGGKNADFYICPNRADIYSPTGNNLPGIGAPYTGVPANYTGVPSQQEFVPTAGKLNRCSVFKYASQIPGTDRAGILLEATYDLAPSVKIYSDVLFSHVQQFSYIAPPILVGAPGFQSYTVGATNPYNPFGEAVGVSDLVPELGREAEHLTTNYLNAVVGVRGDLFDSWRWDLGIWDSEDRTRYTQPSWNQAQLQAALNSANPATALNPFVAGPIGPLPLLQSLVTQNASDFQGRTSVVNGILRGPVMNLPAGALQVALGAEYERDTLYENAFFYPGPAQSTNFHRSSYALFTEARLPIIGPATGSSYGGDRLVLTAAGRFDHYDDFGGKSTPQFGVDIRPFEPLLLRASYSRSFRAPDLIDLYAARSTYDGAVADPLRGNAIEIVKNTIGGNPGLQPELGLSRTFGLVYSSETFQDLRLAVTWWEIDETKGIQQLPAQVIVDNAALFPEAVTRASSCQGQPPCPITAVTATYLNFGNLDLAGLDYQLTYKYRTGLGTFTPSITVTQTYRYRTTLTPGSPVISAVSAAQDTGDWAPRWKGTAALEWRLGVWTTNLAGRYVGKYQDYDSTAEIGNFWLVDADARCAVGRILVPESKYWQNAYARFGAVNLFNRLPQFSNFEFDAVGYDPAQADIRGRFLYAQLGVKW